MNFHDILNNSGKKPCFVTHKIQTSYHLVLFIKNVVNIPLIIYFCAKFTKKNHIPKNSLT